MSILFILSTFILTVIYTVSHIAAKPAANIIVNIQYITERGLSCFFGIRWVLKGERQIIILYWHGIKNQPIRKAHGYSIFALKHLDNTPDKEYN